MPSQILHEVSTYTGLGVLQTQKEQYRIEKQADQAITNSTVLTNDNDLFFAQTNTTDIWDFEIEVRFNLAGTTSGYKFAITGSAAPTSVSYSAVVLNGVSPGAFVLSLATNAFGTSINGALATAGDHILKVKGTFEATAAGNLQLQFAQNTTDAVNAITVKRGSFLAATRLK